MTSATNVDQRIRSLILIGGVAALIAAIFFRRNLTAEYFLFKSMGFFANGPLAMPQNTIDWLTIFHQSKFYGLLFMNFFDLINFILIGFMYLAIYQTLKFSDKSLSLIAALLIFSGIVLYLSSTQVFTMVNLSDRYFQTNDLATQSSIVNTGNTLLTLHDANATYTTGLFLPYLLVTLGGLLFSIAMLKSGIFSRPTAIIGIIATAFGLCFYITAPVNPTLNVIPIAGSAPFLMVWYILVGIKLIKIGKECA